MIFDKTEAHARAPVRSLIDLQKNIALHAFLVPPARLDDLLSLIAEIRGACVNGTLFCDSCSALGERTWFRVTGPGIQMGSSDAA
jgi:hypothetical protein